MQRFSVWRYRSYNNFTIMLLRFHSHLWIFLFDIPACPHGPSTIIFSTTGQWCSERFILFLILVIHSTHCTPFLIYVLKKPELLQSWLTIQRDGYVDPHIVSSDWTGAYSYNSNCANSVRGRQLLLHPASLCASLCFLKRFQQYLWAHVLFQTWPFSSPQTRFNE